MIRNNTVGEPGDKSNNSYFPFLPPSLQKIYWIEVPFVKTSVFKFVVFSHLLGIEQISKASVAVSTLVVHVVSKSVMGRHLCSIICIC